MSDKVKNDKIWARASRLETDEHVRKQVKRIRKARRILLGDMHNDTFEESLRTVCLQIAILEHNPDKEGCNNDGRIMVQRAPGDRTSFTIYLDAATVYGMQMPHRRENE